MFEMLVIDLDRTLLHTDKTISPYSANVIGQCRKKGIKVVLATARPVRTVASFLDHVPCDAVAYHNGAFVLVGGERVGESHLIPVGDTQRILETIQSRYPGKKLSVEIDDTLYANFDVNEFWNYTRAVMTDFSDLPQRDADKVIIEITESSEYEEVLSLLPPELYGEMSDGKLCLVMNRNATKLNAIRQLSLLWGIPLSAVVAFGDDYNDMEMLKGCGVGVAVGNAIREVADVAGIITDTNDEDGVANYIAKHFL
jgi:5-amino-6-(5-phospho-D-ribitylamino)uracil phosphatase